MIVYGIIFLGVAGVAAICFIISRLCLFLFDNSIAQNFGEWLETPIDQVFKKKGPKL